MIELDLFFRFLKDVAMATNFRAKFGYIRFTLHSSVSKLTAISTLQLKNIQWQYLHTCANLMKIGPVTPKITRITTAPFSTRRQKMTFPAEYPSKYWTDLQQIFSVVDICMAFVLCSPRDVAMVNQLILGPFADIEIDRLHSLLWHSKMKMNAIWPCKHSLIAAIMPLHHVKIWEFRSSNFGV